MRFPRFPADRPLGFVFVPLLAALLLGACAEQFEEGDVSMKVDGSTYAPSVHGDVEELESPEGPWRYVWVEGDDDAFHLGIPLSLGEGRHELGFERSTTHAWLWVGAGQAQHHSAWGEGELVITSQSKTRLRGTFSGTLRNHDQSESIVVTDGKFDLKGSFINP